MTKILIPVYAAEREAGIASTVASSNTFAYHSAVFSTPDALREHLITEQAKATAQQALGGDVTFDLYPIHTILVTTGWNKNDDVFLKHETWSSRSTPEDKPFNLEHRPRQIIGHITNNVVVDDNLAIIANDSIMDDIPDKFHILTSAVIYRHISSRDESLEAEAAELIESIQNGDWCVSMECLFANFDYGVTYSSGEQQLIARSDKTAFLTKHLRIYGGQGEHNGGKLGRVLRYITFSGKGLVEDPANPESVVFNDPKRFVGVFAENTLTHLVADIQTDGDIKMAEDNKVVDRLEAQVSELTAAVKAAEAKAVELGEAQVTAKLTEKDGEIESLTAQVTSLKSQIAELKTSTEAAETAKADAETVKTETETKLTEAEAKLTKIEVAAKATTRVSILVDKGVDKAEAELLVADFTDLDDEKFEKVVALKAAAQKPEENLSEEEVAAAAKAAAEAAAKEDGGDDEGAAAAAAAQAALDAAAAEEDPNLGAGDDDSNDELMTGIAAFLDQKMHG